jgi:hypothetical protein
MLYHLFYKQAIKISKHVQNIVVLCEYHYYDDIPVYIRVVLHTFIRILTKGRQKWHPLVKLYRSVCIKCNELQRVRVISWKMAPVSLGVSCKHKNIWYNSVSNLPTKAPCFIDRFCDEYPTALLIIYLRTKVLNRTIILHEPYLL